jgi:hypothetical protein
VSKTCEVGVVPIIPVAKDVRKLMRIVLKVVVLTCPHAAVLAEVLDVHLRPSDRTSPAGNPFLRSPELQREPPSHDISEEVDTVHLVRERRFGRRKDRGGEVEEAHEAGV